jgi:hypothetical protein
MEHNNTVNQSAKKNAKFVSFGKKINPAFSLSSS